MVKFGPNFCYCAVDQEKAVFQWKRAVSGPSALLGPEIVKFSPNFCYCAVNQEKAVFQWKRAVSSLSALLGLKMVKFGPNFCYCAKIQFNRHCVSERAAPSRELPTPSWPSRSLFVQDASSSGASKSISPQIQKPVRKPPLLGGFGG